MATEPSGSEINPLVSVVLPTFNRASLLGRAIRSVLVQSYPNFELLIVDDGSTDETSNVVAGFCDQRIRYVSLANNSGAGAARNVGIRMARGKFLAFQDSDDEWLPSKLVKQMSAFERGPVALGMVYSDMQTILKDGTGIYFAAPSILANRLINPNTRFYQVFNLGVQSALIKRQYLEAAGYFNESMPALEDLEMFIRLSKHCEFHRLPEPLVRYYDTQGISKDLYASWLSRKLMLKLYYKEILAQSPAFLIDEALWLFMSRRKLRRRECGAGPPHSRS